MGLPGKNYALIAEFKEADATVGIDTEYLWSVLQEMYTDERCRVRLWNSKVTTFHSNTGLPDFNQLLSFIYSDLLRVTYSVMLLYDSLNLLVQLNCYGATDLEQGSWTAAVRLCWMQHAVLLKEKIVINKVPLDK